MAEQEEVHRAVLTEDNRRAAYRALQDRILNGGGTCHRSNGPARSATAASPRQWMGCSAKSPRGASAGDGRGFRGSTGRGLCEDELFELKICAAVGQSARLYDADLAAVADAIADRGGRVMRL